MVYVVTEACVDVQDKSCMQECPADCIFEGGRMTYINPDLCIDCGACVSLCPVEAIFYDAELPEGQEAYAEINERFFNEVETPKGGRKAGKIAHDVEEILALTNVGGKK
ncbi:ferredoxin [Paenarthrobacter sp. NPDC058040]|uniref:ferredoxin n=1 Tax=unclassified Paenarthrobacter TaxID=2634190 RepID=UPI0036DB0475